MNLSTILKREEITSPALDRALKDGDSINFEGLNLEIITTPGHSEDGISIYLKEKAMLFSGDCIFANGIGRTDLVDSNFQDLKNSIEEKIFKLPAEVEFFAGHGPVSNLENFKTRVWPSFK